MMIGRSPVEESHIGAVLVLQLGSVSPRVVMMYFGNILLYLLLMCCGSVAGLVILVVQKTFANTSFILCH